MSETKNILVVDDDPEILRMVATYLTGEEYGVETASNGTRIAGASCILGWDGGRNFPWVPTKCCRHLQNSPLAR